MLVAVDFGTRILCAIVSRFLITLQLTSDYCMKIGLYVETASLMLS